VFEHENAAFQKMHMMGQGMRCFIYVIAPERSLVSILDVLIG
jgi:hypothetical protein